MMSWILARGPLHASHDFGFSNASSSLPIHLWLDSSHFWVMVMYLLEIKKKIIFYLLNCIRRALYE